jgi:hypothetical protein
MPKVEINIQKGQMKVDLQDFREDDPACKFMQSIMDSAKAQGVEAEAHVNARQMREHGHVHDYNGGH